MSASTTRIRIFYPADPLGVVPGGVDTFIRGLIGWAPEDLAFSLVGMSTDPVARPVGQWTSCQLGARSFDFHPVVAVSDAGRRGRVPLSVRFMVGVNRDRLALADGFEVFDFHRLEPALMWSRDLRPKNAYFHQDPTFVRLRESDSLWRGMPGVYERIERRAMRDIASAWCVRESGVQTLRERYPDRARHIQFVPTWVDPQAFHPVDEARRGQLRQALGAALGVPTDEAWVVSVGRLDTQKDPQLMLQAVARLHQAGRAVRWLAVGDGVLKPTLERLAREASVGDRVHWLGLRSPAEIADILRAADVFGLSSAYEGMPMALLEALGSGLPAVTTDVGEVRRVMRDGCNGRVVAAREPEAFAEALAQTLDHAPAWRQAALAAVAAYHPQAVLAPAYENYRRLGEPLARLRARVLGPVAGGAVPGVGAAESAAVPAAVSSRRRQAVVGVPIDVLDRAAAVRRVMDWARTRQSRYACFVNVHSAIQATQDERHQLVLQAADLTAPDGAPIAWSLRAKGHAGQPRVDGPGLMWRLCEEARNYGVRIGLYGSTPETLERLTQALVAAFPGIDVAYAHSPPFRALSDEEDLAVCADVAAARVGLLFVGLGCPKQEAWMAEHRGRIPAVMLGVGAAFEFHAGTVSRAPEWMRERGLEWLHRLASNPSRLWRRYLVTNSLFVARSAAEALRGGFAEARRVARRSDVS